MKDNSGWRLQEASSPTLPLAGSAVDQAKLLRALFHGSWKPSLSPGQGCPLFLPQSPEGATGLFTPPPVQMACPHAYGPVCYPSLVPPANLTGCTFSPFQVTDKDITHDQPQSIPCGIPQGTSLQEGMVQWLSHLSPTTQSIFTTLVGHAPPHPNNQLGYRDIVGRCWKPC